ncbi:fumarylacetoacetate hydrolase family protein [Pseudomonas sp. 2FG]|uniref:fumarylacetoacetate hydrolase family protein n=1 Tax=Pseudomonas sp. 2FG TaxID=2502191 RepID=UPI001C4996E2|nr:fumarylacetoacetate hydrolase family protein [Pseudomonas sp. 2FG]
MFGIALNYRGLLHSRLDEFHQPPYQKPPVKPVLFIKTPNTRNAHNQPVVFPKDVERLQPGPALGVVIGKKASRVSLEEAMQYVAGYCIVNEFSLPEDSYYRPAVKAKCRDGFCSVGPWVVDAADIVDPHNLPIKLYVNGQLRQENNSSGMIRSIALLIAELSEFMTLNEGDLLITGTPEGRVDVQPGDVVEVEIDGIGRLSNTVVAE